MALLEVSDLTVTLHSDQGAVRPVDGVSFSIEAGEMLCLVGESGSGKSMTALTVMRLAEFEAALHVQGSVRFAGRELLGLPQDEMRALRGRAMAMVFQEPMTALNPVRSIGRQLLQVGQYHMSSYLARRRWLRSGRGRVAEALAEVGIPDPETVMRRYPHQLSGGMRQRVVIAMALLGSPALLIADEPTTALDVTTQAQILDLLAGLRDRTGMAVLLITHDMGVAAEMASRVAVMYAGRLVEASPAEQIFGRPGHPYTRGLLAAVPSLQGTRRERLSAIPGSVPRLDQMPGGCRFAPRCPHATAVCHQSAPDFRPLAPGRSVACWHAEDLEVTA